MLRFLIVFLVLLLSSSLPAFETEETSLRPKIRWAPVKEVSSYKIKFTQINNDGTKGNTVINQTVTSGTEFQPQFDLTANSIYKVVIKTVGKIERIEKYIIPQNKFVSIYSTDVLPDAHSFQYILGGDGIGSIDGSETFYSTAVRLPNGVTISKLKAFYKAASSNPGVSISFIRRAKNGAGSDTIATLSNTTGTETIDIQNAVVDLENYFYYITISLNGAVTDSNYFQLAEVYYYY